MPVPATAPTEAQLLEVFSSIQGEGLLVGCRQIFLRFAHCNLACGYCDTPFAPTTECRIEDAPGSGNFRGLPNPVSLETLMGIFSLWHKNAPRMHHSLSLTGGEPLLQADMLAEWLPALRELLPLYLETNGTLTAALDKVISHLDWISMDIKLASVTGAPTPWAAHRDFLAVARRVQCYVKVVVGEETPPEEVVRAARLVQETAPEAVLVLQPLTREGRMGISARTLLDLQRQASAVHADLRIIPQTHRFAGLL
ncbi:7-carboxy-7-deazaguanine synthase QueE [Geoalkalibacter halelectricus]|uniref:7-carboxy-7-deazaguanine synthase n=1 Tax=Geoalkalibacter halelectricus TaxID=2847045 RepID=A0ABY5ZMV9_9BACT|nr:7-carboxy-7-deazaguanine synthase QueE [Geoalkalibacter halelectricus]MDO3379998.1 7-carboxy-7-deazaguanine synthase QueE [Geoalkalibacter halelectricus]UWZ80475.1 7-carboxy-7-deazaguanine synthase QueE [Geoalkalibacter halelectricus]